MSGDQSIHARRLTSAAAPPYRAPAGWLWRNVCCDCGNPKCIYRAWRLVPMSFPSKQREVARLVDGLPPTASAETRAAATAVLGLAYDRLVGESKPGGTTPAASPETGAPE